MNVIWRRIVEQWRSRSSRERGLVLLIAGIACVLIVQVGIIQPLRSELRAATSRVAALEFDVQQAERLASEAVRLRGALSLVEGEITSSAKSNLFTLLEKLAQDAGIKDRIGSIKPKQPSGNATYPETRVEVALSGATLDQVIQFLYKIERAPNHLIVRSLRLKTQGGKESKLLDARFSVSSFERS